MVIAQWKKHEIECNRKKLSLMVVLIDLDGTLTHTAHSSFKQMKDGLVETNVSSIPQRHASCLHKPFSCTNSI